jgi:TetR/AcrR family transcriptional regulator
VVERSPAERRGRSRRSPAGPERRRDPARTRELILDAALVEFGDHGYAGARTGAIASRAGVNQQLISYYFGGKAGLYEAVRQRWPATGEPLRDAALSLAEVVTGFVRAGAAQRSWGRMLVWAELTGDGGGEDRSEQERTDDAYFAAMVEDLRRRQADGEIAADLDPAYVLLVLFSAALAPHLLPGVAERMTGLGPGSAEFVERYGEQLGRIIARMGDR